MNFKNWFVSFSSNHYNEALSNEKDVDLKQGACIIFTDGKSILLLKRSLDSGNPRTWGLPGGHAKKGESFRATAKRESIEEIGRVEGVKIGKSKKGNWVTFYYKVDKQFPCALNDEHTDWKWIAFDNLKRYNLHPSFKANLPEYLSFLNADGK